MATYNYEIVNSNAQMGTIEVEFTNTVEPFDVIRVNYRVPLVDMRPAAMRTFISERAPYAEMKQRENAKTIPDEQFNSVRGISGSVTTP